MSIVEDVEKSADTEVFRGHFDECLRHLSKCLEAKAPKGLAGAMKARQPIADFCGVVAPTVAGWLEGTSKIIGEQLIKMMCYLDMLGYRVIELERLNGKRELAEFIGYGLLDLQQAADLLGYKNGQDVSAIIQLKQGMSNEREQRMRDICKEKREKLRRTKEEMRAKHQLGFSLMDSVLQRKVSALTNIMEGLLSLLQSKDVGDPFVASLKDLSLFEKRTILQLSDALRELSKKLAQQVQGEKEVGDG